MSRISLPSRSTPILPTPGKQHLRRPNPASRRSMGKLPKAGEWVRLEVPVEQVGLNPGDVVGGWTFAMMGGTVYWDRAGLLTRTPQAGESSAAPKTADKSAESVFLDD